VLARALAGGGRPGGGAADQLGCRAVQFWVFNVRYTARAHTLVVSNVRPEEMSEPRLRSRFLDVGVCQVVPNGGEDYRWLRGGAGAR
jgi:hypothetical protein